MEYRVLSKSLTVGVIVWTSMTGCGRMNDPRTQLKVTNGQEISGDVHPEVILLYDKKKGSVCTGTFISDDTVLTAAHCTMGGSVENTESGEVAGQLQIIQITDQAQRTAKALAISTEIYRNPQWDSAFLQQNVNKYDLGIVKFPAGTSSARAEIKSDPAEVGKEFTIVGFGLNYVPAPGAEVDHSSAGIKRMGKNNIVMVEDGFIGFLGASSTTTADGSNVNSASGDSGGPMFIDGKLAGVTSGGGRRDDKSISLYIDLQSDISKSFLASHGIEY